MAKQCSFRETLMASLHKDLSKRATIKQLLVDGQALFFQGNIGGQPAQGPVQAGHHSTAPH
jgi:hypothetical protein